MSIYYTNLEKERIIHKEQKIDVARLINSSYRTLSEKMKGINKWTIDEIETLCKHYDKDYYYLFDSVEVKGDQDEEMVNIK